MGGNGSGSWYRGSTRGITESHKRITPKDIRTPIRDVTQGQKRLALWGVSWSRGGQPSGSIAIHVKYEDATLVARLIYTITPHDGAPIEYSYPVQLEPTLSNLPGNTGQRWWFRCPLNGCGRRCGVLYLRGAWFGCRTCHGLTYTSCNESGQFDRLARLLAREMPEFGEEAAKLLARRFLRRTL